VSLKGLAEKNKLNTRRPTGLIYTAVILLVVVNYCRTYYKAVLLVALTRPLVPVKRGAHFFARVAQGGAPVTEVDITGIATAIARMHSLYCTRSQLPHLYTGPSVKLFRRDLRPSCVLQRLQPRRLIYLHTLTAPTYNITTSSPVLIRRATCVPTSGLLVCDFDCSNTNSL
jgi:hypothetical protein